MKIVRWGISVLLGVWGIFSFLTVSKNTLYIVAGLITLLLAALVCPALDDKLKGFKYKGIAIAVLIILNIVVYYFIGIKMV